MDKYVKAVFWGGNGVHWNNPEEEKDVVLGQWGVAVI